MKHLKQIFLFATLILFGTLLGGATYSNVVFFPPYLSHLPESTSLLNGPYAIHEDIFWKAIHPLLLSVFIVTIILNWKLTSRRKYIVVAFGIYTLALIATFSYFVPELMAFASSQIATSISASEWLQRGQKWLTLSLIRCLFIYKAFVLLLIGLTKDNTSLRNSY